MKDSPAKLRRVLRVLCLLLAFCLNCGAASTQVEDAFNLGFQSYLAGGYEQAAGFFREATATAPSAGSLHNLGNAEWQCGRAGPAILAWERALWLDPFSRNTHANLRFARKAAQLDAPELAWYEICSTWLPVNAWPWLASLSFWSAVTMVMLPGIFRWRKSGWHQGIAAAGFAIFLLTLPALAGIHARANLGILLPKEAPLRLTPTSEGQILTRLPAGEAARVEGGRGRFFFIRASNAAGWVERAQFGLISAGP